MEEKLFEYEDMLMDELIEIMEKKRGGQSFTEQDICNGEKLLKSMEHIERINMMSSTTPEEDLMYETNYGRNSYGNNSSYRSNQYGNNYGNRMTRTNYSNRRSGHNVDDFRMEIQERLSHTNDPNEKLMLNNWLNELNNR